MARSRLADFMQTHRFWLVDISPSSVFPFLVLGAPFLGFKSITAPEYVAEVENLKQMNSMFKRPVYTGGEVSPITLTRGVRGFDDSMWQWMYKAIKGYDVPYRNLLLVQYTSIAAGSAGGDDAALAGLEDAVPTSAWESGVFLPGKAWILWGAIPGTYKAGSDFDGGSGDVSVAELTIHPWAVTEIAALNPL